MGSGAGLMGSTSSDICVNKRRRINCTAIPKLWGLDTYIYIVRLTIELTSNAHILWAVNRHIDRSIAPSSWQQ